MRRVCENDILVPGCTLSQTVTLERRGQGQHIVSSTTEI
jgi:hypothetical protein